MPFVQDQQRADAAPEQPPEGAMSFSEFVRSRSDDSEMSMLKIIINRLLENEDKTAQAREGIWSDMTQGRISGSDGFLSLLSNDRNASCQRIGFLIGYATAINMESEILTKVQSSFASHRSHIPDFSGGLHTDGGDGDTNGDVDMGNSSGPNEETGTDRAGQTDDVQTYRSTSTDGSSNANAPVATTQNGGTDGNEEANGDDGSPVGGVEVTTV